MNFNNVHNFCFLVMYNAITFSANNFQISITDIFLKVENINAVLEGIFCILPT